MQLHTFIVDSALEAVDRIRSELGPDAVVVSVRKLPANGLSRLWKNEQVEVVASVGPLAPPNDPLEQLREEIRDLRAQVTSGASVSPHSSPASGSILDAYDAPAADPITSGWRLSRLLIHTGLLPVYAEQIEQEVHSVCGDSRPDQLAKELELARNYLKARWLARPVRAARVHLFVGPSGSGKSTVLAKWLAQATLIENHPSVVYQLDTHVANPSPIPSLYSEILGIRFERNSLVELDSEELTFIDLPGFSYADVKGRSALKQMIESIPGCQVHLVLNAAYETAVLLEQARAWASLGAENLILTHLDEESRWGKLWNLVIGTNFRVTHFSSGQNIPGDFRIATPELLFERQFGPK